MTEATDKWRAFPKIELHTHLDCALSYQAVRQLSPDIRLKEYRETFIAPYRCKDLSDFLRRIDPAVALTQTRAALSIAVDDVIDQLSADSVCYAEIRFAPLMHLSKGLTPEEVTETVLEAMHAGASRYGVRCGLILCALRHFTKEQSRATADLVLRYADHGVVALDLAGDEAGFPLENHVSAFGVIAAAGYNAIAHAGEARGAESVSETLDKLPVSRIGHGVRCVEDPSVLDRVLNAGVHLEICPSSNLQTSIYPSLDEHPLRLLNDRGVSVGINTDCRSVTDVTLAQEYAFIEQVFGWDSQEFLQANLNALKASFASEDTKSAIKAQLLARGNQMAR